jgi:hypothetical protein
MSLSAASCFIFYHADSTASAITDYWRLRHAPPALRAPVHCWPLHRRSMTLRRRSRLIPARFAPVAEDIWLSSKFSLAGPSPGHHQTLPTHPGEWRREPARPEAKPGSSLRLAANTLVRAKAHLGSLKSRPDQRNCPAHSVQPKKNAGRARPPTSQNRRPTSIQRELKNKIPISSARCPRVRASKTFVRLRRPKLFRICDGPLLLDQGFEYRTLGLRSGRAEALRPLRSDRRLEEDLCWSRRLAAAEDGPEEPQCWQHAI